MPEIPQGRAERPVRRLPRADAEALVTEDSDIVVTLLIVLSLLSLGLGTLIGQRLERRYVARTIVVEFEKAYWQGYDDGERHAKLALRGSDGKDD